VRAACSLASGPECYLDDFETSRPMSSW
jgi:hypothetical protein